VYLADYGPDGNEVEPRRRERLSAEALATYRSEGRRLVICGEAALKYQEILGEHQINYQPGIKAGAKNLLPLAERAWQQSHFVDPAYFEPTYIAPPNITTPKEKRPARGGTNQKKSHQP
ncbi:MAG: hypothetical protein KDC54_12320, partial [Lewinella sp.]|nr:hypothetical protein [Lewinella sp.]